MTLVLILMIFRGYKYDALGRMRGGGGIQTNWLIERDENLSFAIDLHTSHFLDF